MVNYTMTYAAHSIYSVKLLILKRFVIYCYNIDMQEA